MATIPERYRLPSVIESGATVRFSDGYYQYSNADWNCQFALNDGVNAPLVVAGTPSATGGGFDFVITAAQTTTLKAGRFNYAFIFTAKTGAPPDVYIGEKGGLDVVPGIGVAAAPTQAETMVTNIQAALLKLNSTTNQSFNFNGQSAILAQRADLQSQLVYWQSRVLNEKARVESLRGNRRNGGAIGIEFQRPEGRFFPYYPGFRNF